MHAKKWAKATEQLTIANSPVDFLVLDRWHGHPLAVAIGRLPPAHYIFSSLYNILNKKENPTERDNVQTQIEYSRLRAAPIFLINKRRRRKFSR